MVQPLMEWYVVVYRVSDPLLHPHFSGHIHTTLATSVRPQIKPLTVYRQSLQPVAGPTPTTHFRTYPASDSPGAHATARVIPVPNTPTGPTLGAPHPKSTCLKHRLAMASDKCRNLDNGRYVKYTLPLSPSMLKLLL